jgi:serine/threonine-protein kinase
VFKGQNPDESRNRILTMPIPDFRKLDKRVDDRLNDILQKALARDPAKRYPTADELLYDLEHYIYHSGYGPTNETLGKMVRELFGQNPQLAASDAKGSTRTMERTARLTRKTKAA